MRVYRIEDANGYGAYRICSLTANDEYRHPSPNMDSLLSKMWIARWYNGTHREWYFGFKDMDQFRAWFYNDLWLEQLQEAGGKLTIWEVPDQYVNIGNTQVIFKRKEATLIETLELI